MDFIPKTKDIWAMILATLEGPSSRIQQEYDGNCLILFLLYSRGSVPNLFPLEKQVMRDLIQRPKQAR